MDKLIEATMLRLSTVDEVKDSELLALGRTHLEADTLFASAEALRDHLIELIGVESVYSTWGILRWEGAMCEALNISKAVARRAEAPGSRTVRQKSIPTLGTVQSKVMQLQEFMSSLTPAQCSDLHSGRA